MECSECNSWFPAGGGREGRGKEGGGGENRDPPPPPVGLTLKYISEPTT